jgi:hypothetical protein
MTVPEFRHKVSELMGVRSPITLMISPDWVELDHLGPVSALVYPGTSSSCPYLTNGSIVRARRVRVISSPSDDDIEESPDDPLPAVVSLKRPRNPESSSEDAGKDQQSSSSVDSQLDGPIRVTPSERRQLHAEFRKEAQLARSKFKDQLVMEWHEAYPSIGDKENQMQDHSSSTTGLSDSAFSEDEFAFDHFVGTRMEAYDSWASERKASFLSSLRSRPPTPTSDQTRHSAQLQQERTQALWEGLRRKFFGEQEGELALEHSTETQEDNAALQGEIAELMEQLRRRRTRFPTGPPPPFGPQGFDPDNSDDSPPDQTVEMASQGPSDGAFSSPFQKGSPEPRRSNRNKPTTTIVSAPVRRRVKDRWFFELVPPVNPILSNELSSSNQDVFLAQKSPDELSSTNHGVFLAQKTPGLSSRTNQEPPSDPNETMKSFVGTNGDEVRATPRSLIFGCTVRDDVSSAINAVTMQPELSVTISQARKVLLSQRTLRKILVAKETLFKFGTFVPRNESEAQRSPEASRWMAGRDLEWHRMGQRETFARDWTWNRIQREFPQYLKSDIGHLFYVFDYKYSGEHRVRLVFDGSRQSPSTYTETYAPAARQESVRLFHIILVEEGYFLGQYDVPQAFLLAPIDTDIFVYPPNGQSEYPGQILKLRKALYGGKQSAFLWFTMINTFILELGFVASPMDSCLYKKHDAILILYCDDLRIGASSVVLASLQAAFFERFAITTAPGDRFLGMDTVYQRDLGYLKLSMTTYIDSTIARFEQFDLSCGVPFRELVGCLLWITLCVLGPELLRVKDLARRSNSFTHSDYQDGLKVLKRIAERKLHGIVIFRNAATREILPAYRRPSPEDPPLVDDVGDFLASPDGSEVTLRSLCQAKAVDSFPTDSNNSTPACPTLPYGVPDDDAIDIPRVDLPVNHRYRLIAFGDASFAIGELKQSVSGFIIYLNGVPLMWGSLKQTIVVDSSCSAEFVAASIVTKQILNAENMIAFFGFTCPKPYRLYTDSMACLHIGTNPAKLGNVRHLHIRYHLVRCVVSFGDVAMFFCVTEAMIADLFTKIVSGAQDARLSLRFYSLLPASSGLVLGISPLDPATLDSRVSAFLYPAASSSISE